MNRRPLCSSLARSPRAAGLGVALLLAFPTVEFAASFQGLGNLAGGNPPHSIPHDISPNGAIVVGESHSANGLEAYRWSKDTGMVALGYLGGEDFFSTAWRISADGLVIVGASRSPSSGERTEAFRWTAELGMVGMGDLPGGAFSSSARGVSADGTVITGVSTSELAPSLGELFRWTESTGLEGLGTLGGSQIPAGVPWQISRDGTTIVGWSSSENGREAFRWTRSEGMVGLGDLPGLLFDSQATDVRNRIGGRHFLSLDGRHWHGRSGEASGGWFKRTAGGLRGRLHRHWRFTARRRYRSDHLGRFPRHAEPGGRSRGARAGPGHGRMGSGDSDRDFARWPDGGLFAAFLALASLLAIRHRWSRLSDG
jgi:probable HAF family extracellular repeat protein